MSRIGKLPIPVPSEAKIQIDGRTIHVSGPKGKLSREVHDRISLEQKDKQIIVKRMDDSRISRAMHGLTRSLINNMVVGVTSGFQRELIVTGVGYKVEEKDKGLQLALGFSNPIDFRLPDGVAATVEKKKEIKIVLESYDKELLGQVAANIRSLRPPEPYKGKGIRYSDERIIRKAGKAAVSK